MFVFKFKVFYDIADEDAQYRYVVASDDEDARAKLQEHFDFLAERGYSRPAYISDPTVELQNIII